jgi:hypothetical protein
MRIRRAIFLGVLRGREVQLARLAALKRTAETFAHKLWDDEFMRDPENLDALRAEAGAACRLIPGQGAAAGLAEAKFHLEKLVRQIVDLAREVRGEAALSAEIAEIHGVSAGEAAGLRPLFGRLSEYHQRIGTLREEMAETGFMFEHYVAHPLSANKPDEADQAAILGEREDRYIKNKLTETLAAIFAVPPANITFTPAEQLARGGPAPGRGPKKGFDN